MLQAIQRSFICPHISKKSKSQLRCYGLLQLKYYLYGRVNFYTQFFHVTYVTWYENTFLVKNKLGLEKRKFTDNKKQCLYRFFVFKLWEMSTVLSSSQHLYIVIWTQSNWDYSLHFIRLPVILKCESVFKPRFCFAISLQPSSIEKCLCFVFIITLFWLL